MQPRGAADLGQALQFAPQPFVGSHRRRTPSGPYSLNVLTSAADQHWQPASRKYLVNDQVDSIPEVGQTECSIRFDHIDQVMWHSLPLL